MNYIVVDNKVIFSGDKTYFVVWRTKGGRPIPIFGRGEKHWSRSQVEEWKKDASKRKEISKRKAEYKTFESVPESDKWAEKHYSNWRDNLSEAEDYAIGAFKLNSYKYINKQLREPGFKTKHEVEGQSVNDMIVNIDKALSRTSLPEDVTAYRGFRKNPYKDNTRLIGSIITDKGFVSASLVKKVTEIHGATWEEGVMMKLRIPKGTKAGYLDKVRWKKEAELLLPRNSKFKVLSIGKEKGINMMEVEVIK